MSNAAPEVQREMCLPILATEARRPLNSYSSTKVTFMMTWHSTTRLPSTRTSCSFIHALRTFRSVAVALWMPCWIASSKLFSDVALISVILATDTSLSFRDRLSGFWHPVMPVSTEMLQPSTNVQIERSRNVLLTD